MAINRTLPNVSLPNMVRDDNGHFWMIAVTVHKYTYNFFIKLDIFCITS